MKYMKKVLVMGMCVFVMMAMVGCGDTMNSATDGTKDDMIDPALDEMYNDDESMMEDLKDGVDDLIDGTENMLDDLGEDIMNGTNDSVMDDIGEGANYGNTEIKETY